MRVFCPVCHAELTQREPYQGTSNGPSTLVEVPPCPQHGGVRIVLERDGSRGRGLPLDPEGTG